jgi:translation initiation factor IF-2
MAENIQMRLSKAASKANVGIVTIIENLSKKGHDVVNNPNTKLTSEQLDILVKDFGYSALLSENETVIPSAPVVQPKPSDDSEILYFRTAPEVPKVEEEKPKVTEPETVKFEHKLEGPKILGKIDLDAKPKPAAPKIEVPVAPVVETKAVELPKIEEPTPTPPVVVVEKPIEKEVIIEKVVEPIVAPPVVEKPIQETPPVVVKNTQPPVAVVQPVVAKKPEAPKPAAPKANEPQRGNNNNNNKRNKPIAVPAPQRKIDDTHNFLSSGDNKHGKKEDPRPKPVIEAEEEVELIKAKGDTLQGLKVLGKIELPVARDNNSSDSKKKRKRKRVPEKVSEYSSDDTRAKAAAKVKEKEPVLDKVKVKAVVKTGFVAPPVVENPNKKKKRPEKRDIVSDSDVKDNIKQTMARMQSKGPEFGAKYRRSKRKTRAEQEELQNIQDIEDSGTLRVTEFISAAELSSMMDVTVTDVIGASMKMGMFVSINQRLDAEAIQMIALEFGFDVEFISADEELGSESLMIEDAPEDLLYRAPIVTIMGHVDHGKTSLLDYIRRTKVAAGEAGGITQHIGAYSVAIKEGVNKGKSVTFLDTPGHEAFTAMRARGAKVTDVVIVVIAADDSVMPQTREAINHAQNAGVPIVFALNKVDKAGANPNKIREDLAKENILVESWGGKYQEQEVSAKQGLGIDELLDKVLLEAEMLELKANPNRSADGTVIEAALDKGRGYVSTILVQNGTLKVGDILLAGQYFGRVRAMVNDRGERIEKTGPSTPVQILGLPGAPQAGDKFNVMETDREAREIANKREQIIREQSIRAKKHITLDEIGRRKAIGTFQELNVIVKGDVDGSVEALTDSLLKLSTEEIQVRIIHKGVGQISESDILLASAADAIVIGFQVRPSLNARKVAENEEIEIRLYSIIYDAINELRDALEGMLAPKEEEVIVGNVEIREVFKISKIGTVAGCYVLDGNIKRNHKIRIIREGIVMHTGEISALKRYKDDVADVRAGFECGLSIKNFNDIQEGDIVESFEIREVKRKL